VAQGGAGGGHQQSTGKSGADTEVLVPVGTIIYRLEGEERHQEVELLEDGQRFIICKGGNGGWGNWHFKSSVDQTPERANNGLPGEAKDVLLELKLIADVGLVGLPNAGKSTLLSVISAAKPKIANYPFTTLEPQLGVAKYHEHTFVVADLPGLIEGASDGKGLGDTFLRHVERTKALVHCLDAGTELEQLVRDYATIRTELEAWSPTLAAKQELVVLTKADAADPEELEQRRVAFAKKIGKEVITLSGATHSGLESFYRSLIQLLA
jgi:GTPase